jgi:hypothetical protein
MLIQAVDPNLPWNGKLQAWYERLDAVISAEEKDKTPKDYGAWASEINQKLLLPIAALFQEKYGAEVPLKVQLLDANPKVKKDDHLKRLKANRYNIYTYQRKVYLEETGEL